MTENIENELLLDNLKLVEAMYALACESEEAETVRIAFAALSSTGAGRRYLEQHPVVVG